MRGIWAALSAIAVMLVVAPCLSAKGNTIRIVIRGGDLAAPVQIADVSVAGRFHVWSGPGTSSNEPQGLIVDWSRGTAVPPRNLPRYEISFVTTRRDPGTYVVSYVIDPATNRGYVYLPGKTDPEYKDNVWLIYRGVEGRWFHAWSAWEQIAHPLIARAAKAR